MRELNKYSAVCKGFLPAMVLPILEPRAKKQEARQIRGSILVLASCSVAILLLNWKATQPTCQIINNTHITK